MSALFAATHADRTRALIMYGSYAKGSAADDYPWAPEREQIEAAAEMIDAEWGHGHAGSTLYAPSVAGDPEFARWWARYQRLAASPAMAKAVIRLAAEIDIRDVLPAISVPTLVLHRSGDLLWPVEGARFVAESIPGARFVELPGIDHFPFAGDVEPLLDEVESFLTGTRQAPEPDRQLLTVLFTDIVGSTEQRGRAGRSALARSARAARRARAGRARALPWPRGQDDGRRVPGDCSTVRRAAIACARAISRCRAPLGIEVRAGLHTGECERVGDDVARAWPSTSARGSGLWRGPARCCVSSTVKDLVVGSGIEFEPRGARELKGVPGEWSVFAATGHGRADAPAHARPAQCSASSPRSATSSAAAAFATGGSSARSAVSPKQSAPSYDSTPTLRPWLAGLSGITGCAASSLEPPR